jgi:hypothetical protein
LALFFFAPLRDDVLAISGMQGIYYFIICVSRFKWEDEELLSDCYISEDAAKKRLT